MDDGSNRGQFYISIKGTKQISLLSKASDRFTFMGVTAATDEPVLYIYVLSARTLSVTDVKVFDYSASILYELSNTV